MKNNVSKFIMKLEEILIDSKIKDLIKSKISFYSINGKLHIRNNELYGTYINKCDLNRATPAKEFLEIKIQDNNVVCNFSEYSNRKLVNITQNTLKGGNTRIYKKETEQGVTYNYNNVFDILEQERIYNYQKSMVYESDFKRQSDFDTFPYEDSNMMYNKACSDNEFSLERKWYIYDGVIIRYKLSKSFMSKHDNIYENYSICSGFKCSDTGREYRYKDLDKEIFKAFMSGEISIHQVLDKVRNQKRLLKNKE